MFKPSQRCQCLVQCSYVTYRAQDYMIRFLHSLIEQYAAARSQIMLLDPLPNINHVFSMIVQQERQLNKYLMEESKVLANMTTGGKKMLVKSKATSKGKMCSHCGKGGHTVEVCYKKHDYPPGFK